MSTPRPKIRTSMQMSRESIEALRSLCRQSEAPLPSPPLLPKKILKIPQFSLLEPTSPGPVPKTEAKLTISNVTKKAFSVAQSPVSDPTYKPDKFQQAAQRHLSQRRRSALGPAISQIFKEDIQPIVSPTPSEPLFLVPALKPVSSDELDESSHSEEMTSPVVRRPWRLSKTPRPMFVPVKSEESALLEYSLATAKVLTTTRDLVKRHATQRVPARLFKM